VDGPATAKLLLLFVCGIRGSSLSVSNVNSNNILTCSIQLEKTDERLDYCHGQAEDTDHWEHSE